MCTMQITYNVVNIWYQLHVSEKNDAQNMRRSLITDGTEGVQI